MATPEKVAIFFNLVSILPTILFALPLPPLLLPRVCYTVRDGDVYPYGLLSRAIFALLVILPCSRRNLCVLVASCGRSVFLSLFADWTDDYLDRLHLYDPFRHPSKCR